MKWLNRVLLNGPYLALCTTEAEYKRVVRHLRVDDPEPWLSGSQRPVATMHSFTSGRFALACVVCAPIDVRDPDYILIHEAVHVWQRFKDAIGEDEPSREMEAYSIESIAVTLIEAHKDARRKARQRKNKR